METGATRGSEGPAAGGSFGGSFACSRGAASRRTAAATRARARRMSKHLRSVKNNLRTDNEQLAAAGETMRRKADELLAQSASLSDKLARTIETKGQEIELLRHGQAVKEKESSEIKMKVEELEMRLSTNIQKIRVRERELENRLELAKMEGTALIRSKDEYILDLKRQLDQANSELENYRNKGQELNRQINDKQEMLRRTVKALRIALSMLESDEEVVLLKKVK